MNSKDIPIKSILVEDRKRENFGDLDSLVASIKASGGLINPILVEKIKNPEDFNNKEYRLIAGERRLRSCTLLNYETIPATIREDITELEYQYLEFAENNDRKDFDWWEEVESTSSIHQTLQKIAKEEPDSEILSQVERTRSNIARQRWGMRDTAALVSKSLGNVHNDIQLALAVRIYPDLKKAKSKLGAQQMLEGLKEQIILEELGKDFKNQTSEGLSFFTSLGEDGEEEDIELGGDDYALRGKREKGEREEEDEEDLDLGDILSSLSDETEDKKSTLQHTLKASEETYSRLFNSTSSSLQINTIYPHTFSINEDAFKVLDYIKDHSVDLVVTDPPYALEMPSVGPNGQKFQYEDTFEYIQNCIPRLISALYRVTKQDSFWVFFCSAELEQVLRNEIFSCFSSSPEERIYPELDIRSKNLIWVKDRGGYSDTRFNLTHSYEIMLLVTRGRKRISLPHSDIFSHPRLRNTVHVGEKPTALIEEILDVFSVPGEVVLDPMMGSGSTLCATIKKARAAIGIELHERTYGVASIKFAQVIAQMREDTIEKEEKKKEQEKKEKETKKK